MSTLAVIPAWVAPSAADVKALHYRAHDLARLSATVRPVAATLDWVTGDHFSPMTQRWLEPTENAARSEFMLAQSMAVSGVGLADDLWELLGVPPAESVPTDLTDPGWLAMSAATLSWLLGIQRRPPLPLHRR